MKKFLHLSLLLTIILLTSFNNMSAGTLVMVSSDTVVTGSAGEDLHSYAVIQNTGLLSVTVRVKMIEMSRCPGHEMSFCWKGCLLPDTTKKELLSQDSVTLGHNETSGDLFVADLFASDVLGESVAKFVFFDVNDPSNNVEYTVHFLNGITGVQDEKLSAGSLSAIYPNPVADQAIVKINTDTYLPSEINIYNTTGSLVGNVKIQSGTSSQTINTSNLPTGSYFYSLLVNGVVKETRPFIVAR